VGSHLKTELGLRASVIVWAGADGHSLASGVSKGFAETRGRMTIGSRVKEGSKGRWACEIRIVASVSGLEVSG
jgi:hypothetical protein